jgi:uncharacterized membrane protein
VTLTDAASVRSRAGASLAGVLGLFVAAGAVLRVVGIFATQLNFDEAFTAVAGRHSLGDLASFLRFHDSHPPLDYLLHAPLAQLGVADPVFRLPSVVCSVAALALFAWWMRGYGRTGIIATAVLTVDAFQIVHGREARMYADLELLGVGLAVLAAAWWQAPRRWHAPLLGVLVAAGLLTHVSMFLYASGLFLLPGRRTDRDAWTWRGAIVAGGAVWALLWGPAFVTQSTTGHSDWIRPTSLGGFIDAVGPLAGVPTVAFVPMVLAVALGIALLVRRDRDLGRIVLTLVVAPVLLAVITGFFAPVLIDRTLTLMAWGPALALGVLVDVAWTRRRALGIATAVLVAALVLPFGIQAAFATSGPTPQLHALEAVARPGDVVGVVSSSKGVELDWSLGVHSTHGPTRAVAIPAIPDTAGLALTGAPPTGRLWLLDWRPRTPLPTSWAHCAPTQYVGRVALICFQLPTGSVRD